MRNFNRNSNDVPPNESIRNSRGKLMLAQENVRPESSFQKWKRLDRDESSLHPQERKYEE